MGDKSPKSKVRDQKQRDVVRADDVATAKAKRDSHTNAPPPGKNKK